MAAICRNGAEETINYHEMMDEMFNIFYEMFFVRPSKWIGIVQGLRQVHL